MAESLRTVILQEIKARFPKITWKLGSVVRELIVEPVSSMADIISEKLNKAEADLDISTILQSPAEHEDALDLWMSRLGLTEGEPRYAKGSIKLILSANVDMTVVAGTVFYWGDTRLAADLTTIWGPNGRAYKKLGAYSYEAEISVTSLEYMDVSLSSGSPVNWDAAPDVIYDIVVGSPITGGSTEMNAQEKAAAIADALTPKSFTNAECFDKALRAAHPSIVLNAVAGKADYNKTNAVTVYAKTINAPAVQTLTTTTAATDDSVSVVATFPGIGVTQIHSCYGKYGEVIPATMWHRVIRGGELGSSGSFIDVVFDSRFVTAGTSVSIEVTSFTGYSQIRATLDKTQQSTPFLYTLKTPVVANIAVHLKSGDDISTAALAAVSSYISSKPLNATVTSGEISAVLSTFGYTLTGAAIFSATIHAGGITRALSRTNSLSLAGEFGVDNKPVAMYCATNDITVG